MSDNKIPETTNLMSENIINHDINTEMKDSYLAYAMSVIKSRALPDVRDGLKPVHRRILYAMHKLGITSGSKFVKSARVVGEVIGKYHPHGDSSVYEAMVRLAQDFSMRYPLILGQGNFGSIDGDGAAAMRYTEARMQKITPELLADIEKDTVRFRDNYDGSLQEPVVLPSKLPTLLLNGTMGIAVGMATNIPPHNLNEIIGAVDHLVDNPEASIDDLLEFVKGPDFPTSGLIYDTEQIKSVYHSGRGSIIMRGKADINENEKTGRQNIIITELPYQVNKATLVERIADLVREKTIEGIAELRDESNREGIRVFIGLKKDAFGQKILNQLFQLTNLQSSFGVNMIALTDGGTQPKLMNLKGILGDFIAHRVEVITNRTKYDLALAEARKHILDGLKKALDSIDAIIKTIRASKTKEEAKQNLIAQFDFSEIQADAILAMRLQTLAGLERQKIDDELLEKITIILDLKDILAKPERIRIIIKEETNLLVEKYGDKRRTEIVSHGLGKFDAKQLIPNLDMIVTISSKGYIKRVPTETYASQNRGGKGIKGGSNNDGDQIIELFHAKNHDELLFFTDNGRCFKLYVYEIPQASRIARGQALVNFLNLQKDEKISTVLNFTQSDGKFIFMATTNGTVKKSPIEDFENVRKSGLIAAKVKPGNLLKWVKVTDGEAEIMLVSREGKSIRFSEKDVRVMGRTASGVRGIRLKGEDEVIEMDSIKSLENTELLTVMENGLAKMTKANQYRLQSRGGSGVKVANITAKTGKVAGAAVIEEGDTPDLLLMSNNGLMIRMASEKIPSKGRATQGVIIMRFKVKSDKVSSVSLVPSEEEIGEGREE